MLRRTLAAAGLPTTGRFAAEAGWVSRVWVGAEVVVRLTDLEQFSGAYGHEAAVVGLLEGSDVPHARHLAHGDGPDGSWYVSERLPGQTLHDAWPAADDATRQAMVESLGAALAALHRVPVPVGLLPPWLAGALAGGPWPAYHPPVVGAALQLVGDVRQWPGHDAGLLAEVGHWVGDRLALFTGDEPTLVHGDLHASNVIVDHGRVTGLIDFAEAVAQPADAELDTILRWCARPLEFPPTPSGGGLDTSTLTDLPRWLRGSYPELFGHPQLRERLDFYDLYGELALTAHHPEPQIRAAAQQRLARLLRGHNHLDRLAW